MLPLRLIRIAWEAESLRLGHMTRRTVMRIVFGCFAGALGVGVLVFLHIAAWYWLRQSLDAKFTALVIAGVELVIAVICVVMAARSSPGLVEREALEVRRRALNDIASSMTISAVVLRMVEQMIRRR